ncbi:hypothetical protein [Sinorhizobium sojae]|uniref:hypothetical protein n=1 Tax=Sinorhizobium sojae TaxID=716925 RepID=UPI000552F21E|nr:hypothetical protein [Sinorhizobium sojae]
MANRYVFRLSEDNFSVVVIDELGPINTWSTDPENVCLIFESGIVDATGNKFTCHTGPPNNATVVTLHGAIWDSEVDDSGDATIELGDGCTPSQRWTLIEKQ